MGGVKGVKRPMDKIKSFKFNSSVTIIGTLMQGLEETMSREQSKVESHVENSKVNSIAQYMGLKTVLLFSH